MIGGPRVSADVFAVAGATTRYTGSFVMADPVVTGTASSVRIEGAVRATWPAGPTGARVEVAGTEPSGAPAPTAPPGPATIRLSSPAESAGTTWSCEFVSARYRTVVYEQDTVTDQEPFVSYDTGLLPRPEGTPQRVLTVAGAFADAGVELTPVAGGADVVPVSGAGPDRQWGDDELHAAMVNHASRFADVRQWSVWLLVATAYDHPSPVRGIMFDQAGRGRQGCAVFNDVIAGSGPKARRAQLRTYVHELGHCFNLRHSWEKNLALPPAPLGPHSGRGDRSWMNYPQEYRAATGGGSGTEAYWRDFAFAFTPAELAHLRHAPLHDVIMGGNPFGGGAGDVDPAAFEAAERDESGLELELRTRATYSWGEPVVAEIKLAATDPAGVAVVPSLHPKDDRMSIAVRRPSGRVVLHRPLLRRCTHEARTRRLRPGLAIYDSAYIGADSFGASFDEPGEYRVRGRYTAPDGSVVVSPEVRLRIRPPMTEEDQRVGELLVGTQTGWLFQTLGSRAAALQSGNDALQEVIDEHGAHPLATYARLVRGFPARRPFKELTTERQLTVHPARPEESAALLREVVAPSGAAGTAPARLDNISLNQAMTALAEAEARRGRDERAGAVLDAIVPTLRSRGVRTRVLERVARDVETSRAALPATDRRGDRS
ncbi:hypothetical protein [Actinomycetospora straminea]|uniref:hypothetical protein n=1 Tax=Actinomycetospora straminea TaxID=663607 RepID=UPI002365596D|nr:hypothetical protein [Actinomycetospora straminea]MDD7933748.1 hypothetical protein [Actinomycetospora straminea]